MFSWKPISETELPITEAQRRAVPRLRHANAAFRKTTLTIPEGSTTVLPILQSQHGITVLEVYQKPHSHLTMTYLQNSGLRESTMWIIRCFLEEGAELLAWNGMFGSSFASLLCETHLRGEGSRVHQRTVYFGNSTQVFDMFSTTVLEAPATSALIESRGIMHGASEGRFDGGITITETAKKSDARLFEHTLLLSPDAKMNAIPGLTIETNDVMASHSASMTRIDDDQLFYCKSRGIDESEAVRMIAEGFLAEVYRDAPCKKEIEKLMKKKICTL